MGVPLLGSGAPQLPNDGGLDSIAPGLLLSHSQFIAESTGGVWGQRCLGHRTEVQAAAGSGGGRSVEAGSGSVSETRTGCRRKVRWRREETEDLGVVFCQVPAQRSRPQALDGVPGVRHPRPPGTTPPVPDPGHVQQTPLKQTVFDGPQRGWQPAESRWATSLRAGRPGRARSGRVRAEKVPLAYRTGSRGASQSKGFCRMNRRDTARRDDSTEETPHAHAHATQRRQLHKHTTRHRHRHRHPACPGSPHFLSPASSTDRTRWAPTPGAAPPGPPTAPEVSVGGRAGISRDRKQSTKQHGRPSPSSSLYTELAGPWRELLPGSAHAAQSRLLAPPRARGIPSAMVSGVATPRRARRAEAAGGFAWDSAHRSHGTSTRRPPRGGPYIH